VAEVDDMCLNRLRIRPLTGDDGVALDAVFAGMGEQSRFLRFHSPAPRLSGGMRHSLLHLDGRDRAALVAELPSRDGWAPIGIARLVRTGDRQAELAVAVVDRWQRHGVGQRLLEALGDLATELGYAELYGDIHPENNVMVRLLQRVFPAVLPRWDDGIVRVPLSDWPGRGDPRDDRFRNGMTRSPR
jgi:GNAT superfamily N-acetyltransferase